MSVSIVVAFYWMTLWTKLYVLPGASSPLSSIHYSGGEDHDLLMVLNVDDSAGLWDIKTGEFRWAMDSEKARDALGTLGWFEL